jgi:mono/diheme cytochrome c family protein
VLTVAIAFVALLLPGLVLVELWRTRRVPVPADAPENVLDPVLSTAGMSRKIVFSIVALAEAFLLLIAYTANEPFRQTSAAERQLEFAVENGAHTYIQYCMTCHGAQGRGFLENVGLPGKPLNRADLQVTEGDEGKAARKLVYTTVENGRPGTVMPAWGNQNGGPLNYAMIDELVVLVNQGRWDVVDSFIKHDNVPIPTEPPITNPAETGKKIVTEGACASCHTVANTPANGKVGPALDGIASRQIAGVLDFSRENVKRWVVNPPAAKPGTQMPPYALRDQYLDAIAAYLETLR